MGARVAELGRRCDDARGHLIGRGLHSLTDDGLLKVARTKVRSAPAESVPVPAAAQERSAAALGLAFAFRYSQNLRRIDIHEPRIEHDVGLGVLMAKSADSKAAKTSTAAAEIRILGFVAKLGDAANHDRVDAQDAAQLGRRGRVCTVAVREIL